MLNFLVEREREREREREKTKSLKKILVRPGGRYKLINAQPVLELHLSGFHKNEERSDFHSWEVKKA